MIQSGEWQRVFRGMLLAIVLAITTIAIVFLLAFILQAPRLSGTTAWAFSVLVLNAAAYFIGITQLLYIIPLIIVFWRQRRFASIKGLVIGAAIVGLLNFAYLQYLSDEFW